MRCYDCFRPESFCICNTIPRIDNHTEVLILQHVGERSHRFNTARILRKSLQRCQLVVDHNRRFAEHDLPIRDDAVLVYPDADAPLLTKLPTGQPPSKIVMIDGTWHQAKTIVRDVSRLRELPCFRLQPASPGRYRIRREPTPQSLSTLEATVEALTTFEPDTAGLDDLLAAFEKMVEDQLEHPASRRAWRRKKRRQLWPRYLPTALLRPTGSLVVAYGEATPRRRGQPKSGPLPVNWVARRLDEDDRFSAVLRGQRHLSEEAMTHMRLADQDFSGALTTNEFRESWKRYLRPHDVLVVYHQRTFELLRHIGAFQPRCLVLKSIFGQWQSDFRSLAELIAIEGIDVPSMSYATRADERLNMAVALAEHLRSHYGAVRPARSQVGV